MVSKADLKLNTITCSKQSLISQHKQTNHCYPSSKPTISLISKLPLLMQVTVQPKEEESLKWMITLSKDSIKSKFDFINLIHFVSSTI